MTAERDDRGSPRRDDRGRVHVRLAGGAGGQGSHVLSALATADALAVIPEEHDTPAGRLRGRAVVARPGLSAPTGRSARRPGRYPRSVMDPKPGRPVAAARGAAPPVARRSDRSPADGRRLRQARDRSAGRRRGDRHDVGRDAEPRHRWRRAEGRRARRGRAGRRHGCQAHERADPALPSAAADRPPGDDHARPVDRLAADPRRGRDDRPDRASRWRR